MLTSLGQTVTQQNSKKYIIYKDENRLCHSQPLLKYLNALNVYHINLCQNLNFMQRIKMGNIPEVFHETIKKPNHKHPTFFSNRDYSFKSTL